MNDIRNDAVLDHFRRLTADEIRPEFIDNVPASELRGKVKHKSSPVKF